MMGNGSPTSDGTLARIHIAYNLGILKLGHLSVTDVVHEGGCPGIVGMGCVCLPDILITTDEGDRWLDVGRGWEKVESPHGTS